VWGYFILAVNEFEPARGHAAGRPPHESCPVSRNHGIEQVLAFDGLLPGGIVEFGGGRLAEEFKETIQPRQQNEGDQDDSGGAHRGSL
jgi:hypothetical protein